MTTTTATLSATMTIDGRSREATSMSHVIDPATGRPFARVPDCDPATLNEAVESSVRAFPAWSRDLSARRSALLDASQVLKDNLVELMSLLTAEQGKPLADARVEVLGCARWLKAFANLELPTEVVQDDDQAFVELVRRPVGATAAITAWNFPLTLMCWKIGPALLAGCTVTVKPSPYTPLTTLRFGELLREVLPPGVVNVVSGGDELGGWLTAHDGIRKITFTGSTPTGKHILSSTAHDLKRVTLELGGNDAAIVLGDVDLESVGDSLFWAAFSNCGQICAAVKRVYAPRTRYDEVVEALAFRAREVSVGPGTEEGVRIGPLNNAPQRDRVAELVADAVAAGARTVAGGHALDREGFFYAPTVVADAHDGMRLVDEEQFGPVLPVIAYDDVEDALRAANASPYGLGGSVWSTDLDAAEAIARRLECGTAWVNAHTVLSPHQPFGGLKWSGLGVENGVWGVQAFTDPQVVHRPPR